MTNCRVESNFGGFDNVLRTFESICFENASGIAQQMRMHHFDSATDHVISDRRPRKIDAAAEKLSSSHGFFDSISEKMQEVCCQYHEATYKHHVLTGYLYVYLHGLYLRGA